MDFRRNPDPGSSKGQTPRQGFLAHPRNRTDVGYRCGKTGSGNLAQGQTRRGSEHRSSRLQSPLQCPSPGHIEHQLLHIYYVSSILLLSFNCVMVASHFLVNYIQESGTPGQKSHNKELVNRRRHSGPTSFTKINRGKKQIYIQCITVLIIQ